MSRWRWACRIVHVYASMKCFVRCTSYGISTMTALRSVMRCGITTNTADVSAKTCNCTMCGLLFAAQACAKPPQHRQIQVLRPLCGSISPVRGCFPLNFLSFSSQRTWSSWFGFVEVARILISRHCSQIAVNRDVVDTVHRCHV